MADATCTGWNHSYDTDYGVISPISVNATSRGASNMVFTEFHWLYGAANSSVLAG